MNQMSQVGPSQNHNTRIRLSLSTVRIRRVHQLPLGRGGSELLVANASPHIGAICVFLIGATPCSASPVEVYQGPELTLQTPNRYLGP